MTACRPSIGCKSFNETKSLVALKEICFENSNCIAVSCDVSSNDPRFCHRYMLSSSCDQSTIQKRNGWTYHLMNKGKYTIIFLIRMRKCIYQNVLVLNLSQLSEHNITEQLTSREKTGKCPASHPFAYFHGGLYCCQTNLDKKEDPINLDSRTCENDSKIRCPHGKCINNSGPNVSLLYSCSKAI